MLQLLQQTIDRLQGLESLPEATQQQIAKQVLAVLDRFGASVPRQETVQAMDDWRRRRKGITLGDDLTLRELINEGRR